MNLRSWLIALGLLLASASFALVTIAQPPPEPEAEPLVKPTLNLSREIPNLSGLLDSSDGAEAKWSAELELRRDARDGVLRVTVKVPPEHHVYSITTQGGMPTKFEVLPKGALKLDRKFEAETLPETHFSTAFEKEVEEHRGTAVWSAPVQLAEGFDPEADKLTLQYSGQICKDPDKEGKGGNCRPLRGTLPVKFVGYVEAPQIVSAQPPPKAPARIDWAGLAPLLGMALLGGLILNLMPCVLPVIGLKLLSFARQGGHNRARILGLNLAYTAGLIMVFMILATGAAFLNLKWGAHFNDLTFQVVVVCGVFVMALSFLGVWQLPIPGFATSESAGQLQNKEGYVGAFFKGIFTTLLATPCSGPFLGVVFTTTLKQPPVVIYLVFFTIGLGMALPYLIIGALPGLSRFLPKPGEWMETFEQLLGFTLLGAVVYFLYVVGPNYFIPTFTLMIGLWFGCWLIGRVPEYATFPKRVLAWSTAVLVAMVVGFGAFNYLGPNNGELFAWETFSEARLAELQKQGKTVMVDFTARWCPTCHVNFRVALNRQRVKDLIDKNGVVPMLADWSDHGDAVARKLTELNSDSIPLLAIFPAESPNEPIVLRDAVLENQVVQALEQAGPSRSAESEKLGASTAMRAVGEGSQ